MEKTKAVTIMIVASVLVATVAGIAFAQLAGAQSAKNSTSQIQQGASSSYYPYPQQGSYGQGQSGCPNGHVRSLK